eukprot:scaffold5715_cov85-Skeletonema_marinoi.AAC.3
MLSVNAYPDADFAGLYGYERPDDPACVKSRTGFVILAANCPVMWKSTLQTKTAMSTMEAEITSLAHCCRELFPIMDLAKFLADYFELDPVITKMNVTVHEDNAAALILAKMLPPECTPRSKFFHLETVWFREECVKRGVQLVVVISKEQLGDIFTKGLTKSKKLLYYKQTVASLSVLISTGRLINSEFTARAEERSNSCLFCALKQSCLIYFRSSDHLPGKEDSKVSRNSEKAKLTIESCMSSAAFLPTEPAATALEERLRIVCVGKERTTFPLQHSRIK